MVGEVIILESTLTSSLAFDRFDLISFNLQCFRIAALLLLPAIYYGHKLSQPTNNSIDVERQTLLDDSETSEPSSTHGQPSQIKDYGSLGKGIAVRDYARSGSDGTKSSTDKIRPKSGIEGSVHRSQPSQGERKRSLVTANGQAFAFGTPEDGVRTPSAESNIVENLEKKATKAEALRKPRKATPMMKDTAAKNEAAKKNLVTVREVATSTTAGKANKNSVKKAGTRSLTPTRKAPAPSVGQKEGTGFAPTHAHAHVTRTHDDTPEVAIVKPAAVYQMDAGIEDTGNKADTPTTAQKVADAKSDDKSTPITIRRADMKRAQSDSPSKSVHGSTSSSTKLKPDVPEFVPRSMRDANATDASACSRAHTPVEHSRDGTQSREGSRASSPSKFTPLAPEFIPRHMRTSTDASTSSGTPQSPTTGRPNSPLKLHEMSATSPISAAVVFGSPKRQVISSNSIKDKTSASQSHCMKHDKHILGPATGNTLASPPITERRTAEASPALSKTHLHRVSRREMAKSEPTSHASQMSDSHDGAGDSGNSGSGEGNGSSAETTIKKAAPKSMVSKSLILRRMITSYSHHVSERR